MSLFCLIHNEHILIYLRRRQRGFLDNFSISTLTKRLKVVKISVRLHMPGAHEESQKYQYNVELSWQISHHNCGDFYQRGSCCLIIILLNNQFTELLGETEKHSLVVMSENKTPDIKTGTLEETIYVGRRPTRSGSFCQPERFFMEEERQF